MNEKYICVNCHSIFSEENLEDNEDGTCEYCGHPLEQCNKKRSEFDLMVYSLSHYPGDEIWKNVEDMTNWKERSKYRSLFFQALEKLNKKFEEGGLK